MPKAQLQKYILYIQWMMKKLKNIFTYISYIIVILFCLVMIYYSAGITNHQFITNQKTIAVGMPIAYVSVSLVVGFTLTIIRIIQVMVETFTSKNKKDETHISEGLL